MSEWNAAKGLVTAYVEVSADENARINSYFYRMVPQIDIADFFVQQKRREMPLLDVRSPGEYEKGHIPGAYSLPLFDNEERARVGTLYKQQSREEALLAGLEIVGPKMADFVRKAAEISPNRHVFVHCWRGGMRSGSIGWLLQTAGFETSILNGGYKAYRTYIRHALETPWPLIILGGKTGSGKTDILRALAEAGEQVIDLEGLAKHKGSAFGGLGQAPQPSTEHFENLLFEAISALNPKRRIWVEDESHAIGQVTIPRPFWQQMGVAPTVALDMPSTLRVQRLVREYANQDKKGLIAALLRIQKRLGGQRLKEALAALETGDYATTAGLALEYYDKAYTFCLSQKRQAVHPLVVSADEPRQSAQRLIQLADSLLVSTPNPS